MSSHVTHWEEQVKPDSHVLLSGTGGLSLLHGLVGSHPPLALPPHLPQTALLSSSLATFTCFYPPPRKGYLCSDSDLCRKGGLCQSSGVKNCAAVQRKTSRTSLHHRESCGRLRLELLIVATACVVP